MLRCLTAETQYGASHSKIETEVIYTGWKISFLNILRFVELLTLSIDHRVN